MVRPSSFGSSGEKSGDLFPAFKRRDSSLRFPDSTAKWSANEELKNFPDEFLDISCKRRNEPFWAAKMKRKREMGKDDCLLVPDNIIFIIILI